MGTYFNPVADLTKVGRKLEAPHTYAELVKQLKEGEVLVGHWYRLDRGFHNAPHLFSEREMGEFVRQEKAGVLSLIGYYAVPTTSSGFGRAVGSLRPQEAPAGA